MKARFPIASRFALSVSAASVVLMFTASQVHAVTAYTNTSSDSWATAGNWSAGVPTNGQRISVNAGTTLTYTSGLGYTSDTLFIGSSVAADARALVVSGGAGLATFNISSGTLRATSTSGPTATSLVGGTNSDIDGTLNISGTGVLDLSTTDNANGRVLAIGATSTTGSITPINGTITISGNGLLKVGQLRFNDSANTSTGTNLIDGIINLNGGTLETNSLWEGSSGVAQTRTTSTVNLNGGLLRLTGSAGISASLDNVNVLGGANIEVATGVTATSGKNLIGVGAGGLVKTGTGTLALTDNSTYTGATVISAGALSAGKIVISSGNSSLGNATSAVTLGSAGSEGTLSYTGATDTYTRGFTIGGAGGGRLDVLTAGQTLTIDTASITGSGLFTVGGNGRTVINSAITHAGGLTKGPFLANTTVLTLTNGSNSYNGLTTVQHGAIVVTANGALGDTAAGTVINSAATLALSGGIDYSASETVTGSGTGTIAISGIFADTQRGFIQSASGNNIFRGNIVIDAGGVTRIGTQNGASLTLTGTISQASGSILFRPGNTAGDFVTLSNSGNSFGGNSTIFTGATAGNYAGVRLGVNNALPTAVTISGEAATGSGTALDLNGFNQTLNGLAGANTLNVINSNTSTASTLTLDNLVDRSTTGTLIRGGLGLGTINVNKDGAFTQTLSGTHDYSGTTDVNEGKLVINGNISTSSLTTVASGATLGGNATVGALTVAAGGFVTPGNSPGTLVVNGAYTQAGTYTAEIDGLTPGTQHDQIDVNGTVDITGGSLTTLFTGTYALNDMIFILLNDGTDAITGTFTGVAQGAVVTTYGGFDWKISYVAASAGGTFLGGNDIALMAVPEPNAAALLGGLGMLALLRRRR